MSQNPFNLKLYKSLFRGRTDIYAVRWEKEGRGGYMPAYKVDWNVCLLFTRLPLKAN